MTVFLTSDNHIGHRNIVSGESRWQDTSVCRQFSDVYEHDEWLIGCWNLEVEPRDTVVVLGDWALCSFDRAQEVTARLNGRKVLVRGNHDRGASRMLEMGFSEVFEGPISFHTLRKAQGIAGESDPGVLLCHFPWAGQGYDGRFKERMPVQSDCPEGTVLVHGHTHDSKKISGPHSIHIGVDAWDYTPVPLEEVMEIAERLRERNR